MEYSSEEVKTKIGEAMPQALLRYRISEVLNSVRQVYNGKIWILGGFISSVATDTLYEHNTPPKDLDILLAEAFQLGSIPEIPGFERQMKSHGTLRLKNAEEQVDLFCLPNAYRVTSGRISPTIEEFLKTVPFTIQALAYDLDTRALLHDIGINALRTRTVAVNDETSAEHVASKSQKLILELLIRKAKKLGFDYKYP